MDGIFRAPVVTKHVRSEVQPETFAKLLRDVYESLNDALVYDWHLIKNIPPFQIEELKEALKCMRNNRGVDTDGVTVDMIKHGNAELHECILKLFNTMLSIGKGKVRPSTKLGP